MSNNPNFYYLGALDLGTGRARPEVLEKVPGVRAILKQDLVVTRNNTPVTLPKGSGVIVHPLNDKQYEIYPFRKIQGQNAHLPEGQRDVTVEKNGYIVRAETPGSLFQFSEYYKLSKQVLFQGENSPSLEELAQDKLPNCYFLAAIQSILTHPNGKEFIRGMMRMKDERTVTVRLFKPIKKGAELTFEPVFVDVPAGIINDEGGALSQHKALWVHVLENAFTTLGISQSNFDNRVDTSISSVFNTGGVANKAISMLTGVKGEEIEVRYETVPMWKLPDFIVQPKFNAVDWDRFLAMPTEPSAAPEQDPELAELNRQRVRMSKRLMYAAFDACSSSLPFSIPEDLDPDDEENNIIKGALGVERMEEIKGLKQFVKYAEFYRANRVACEGIMSSETDDVSKLNQLITLAKTQRNVPITNYLEAAKRHYYRPDRNGITNEPSKPFSGQYSKSAMEHFQIINQGLKTHKLVNVGTKREHEITREHHGISGPHAYTVVSTVRRTMKLRDNDGVMRNRDVLFVKLRNPWGHTGRVYQKQQNGTIAAFSSKQAAEFEVELTELLQFIDSIYVNNPGNKFKYDKAKQDLQLKIQSDLPQLKFDSTTHLTQLVQFKREFTKIAKELVQFEKIHLEAISSDVNRLFRDPEITEDTIDEAIGELLSTTQAPFDDIALSQSSKINYLAKLLKHEWLLRQIPIDNTQLKHLEREIILQSPLRFLDSVKANNNVYEKLVLRFINKAKNDLLAAKETFASIKDILSELSEENELEQMRVLLTKRHGLEKVLIHIAGVNQQLGKCGFDVLSPEIRSFAKEVNTFFNQLDENAEFFSAYSEYKKNLRRLDASLEHAVVENVLSFDEVDDIHLALREEQSHTSPNLTQLIEEYEQSDNSQKNEIGTLMRVIRSCIQKLQELWSDFVALFNSAEEPEEDSDDDDLEHYIRLD